MKYNLPMRIFHALTILFILFMLPLGWYMSDLPSDEFKYKLFDLHKSFGLLFLILIIFRICTRLLSKTPTLPENISSIEKKLSKLGHLFLYILVLLMPISGINMSLFGGYQVKFFGFNFLPSITKNVILSDNISNAHSIMAAILSTIIALHILAVIKHYYIDNINLLKRMF